MVRSSTLRRPTPTDVVTETLQAYAERGVFRGFGAHRLAGGGLEFRFRWLSERPFSLRFDARRHTLTFQDLLPEVPYPSRMDQELRRFVAGRSAPRLAEHRRIDPSRLRARCRNRRGSVSITLESRDRDYRYAVKKAVALANEVFFSFLAGPYEEYMVRVFQTPEE